MDGSRRSRRESRLREGFRQSLITRPRRETINFDSENRRMTFGPAQPQKRRSIVDPKWEQLAVSPNYGPIYADAHNVRRSVDTPPARGSDRDDRFHREDANNVRRSVDTPPARGSDRIQRDERTARRNSRRENLDLKQITAPRQNTMNPRKQNRNLLRRDRHPSVGRDNPSQEFLEFYSNPHRNSDTSGPSFNSDEREPSASELRRTNPDEAAASSNIRDSRDRQTKKYPQARHDDYYRPRYRNPSLNDPNQRKHASLTNRKVRGYYNQFGPDLEGVLNDTKFRGEREVEPEVQESPPPPPPPPPPPVRIWSNQTPATYNPPRHKAYISNEYDRPKHERLSRYKEEREVEKESELGSAFDPEPEPPPPPPRPRRPDKWFDPRPEDVEEKEVKRFQGEKIKQEKQVFVWRKE